MTTKKGSTITWTLDYDGLIISLNDYNKSWQKLRALKNQVSNDFAYRVLQNRPPRFEWFELYVSHNTGLDMDNVTGMIKPCVDTLRKQKIIDDDNRKNWDLLLIRYDPELPKNTVRFQLKGEKKK